MTAAKRVSSPRPCRIRVYVVTTLLIVLLGVLRNAGATSSCTLSVGNIQAELPTGTYTVPRDAPTPRQISGFTSFNPTTINQMTCSYSIGSYGPPRIWVSIIATGGSIMVGGQQYGIIESDVPGIGAIAQARLFRNGVELATVPLDAEGRVEYMLSNANFSNHTFGVSLSMALVKFGKATSGTVTRLRPLFPDFSLYETNSTTPKLYFAFQNTPRIVAPTCDVLTPEVGLSAASSSDLSNPGDTSAGAAFAITLSNCPSGLSNFRYKLEPAVNINPIDPPRGMFGLSANSKATGVALQLKSSTGEPVPLGTSLTVPGYSASTGGNTSIPLQVAYIRLASPISPGSLTSQLILMLDYQ